MTKPTKEELKHEYVTTGITITQLTRKYNLNRASVYRWAEKYLWDVERKAFQETVNEKVERQNETRAEMRASSNAEFLINLNYSADKLFAKVNQLLDLDDALAPRDLKSLSDTLLNIKLLRDIKTQEDEAKTFKVEFVGNEWDAN